MGEGFRVGRPEGVALGVSLRPVDVLRISFIVDKNRFSRIRFPCPEGHLLVWSFYGSGGTTRFIVGVEESRHS